MSWKDLIENEFTIITGDDQKYNFLWKNPSRGLEWNVAEFNFPNLEGTLIKKSEMMGRKFSLEIYLTGENHIRESFKFENSLKNKNPCTIQHPYYGNILCVIAALSFDNSDENVTKITGTALETITEDAPKVVFDPLDAILLSKVSTDETFEQAITATPLQGDVNSLSQTTSKNYKAGIPIIKIPEEFEAYHNAFNTANTYIDTLIASPLLAMRYTIALITLPAKFTANVQDRLKLLANEFTNFRSNLANVLAVPSKQIYQVQTGSIISSMCLAAATPLAGNYKNSTDALGVIDIIINNYAQYLEDLDTLQTLNGGLVTSFIPDPESITQLNALVNLTVSNLFSIALSARRERVVYCEKDTNLILLTHRFYGLDPSDANLIEISDNNNFSFSEYIQIKKGRKIIYYI